MSIVRTLEERELIEMLLLGSPDADRKAVIPVRLQSDGTLRNWGLMVGVDENGVEQIAQVNAYNQVRYEQIIIGSRLAGARPSSETAIYTVPANTQVVVDTIIISNTSGTTTFTLGHDVGGGGSLGAGEAWFNITPIYARQAICFKGPVYMAAGDTIRADGANDAVDFQVYGRAWTA